MMDENKDNDSSMDENMENNPENGGGSESGDSSTPEDSGSGQDSDDAADSGPDEGGSTPEPEPEAAPTPAPAPPPPAATEEPASGVRANYAGFGMRFVALVIDWLILGFISWVAILPLLGMLGFAATESGDIMEMDESMWMAMGAAMSGGFMVANFVIPWLYFALMHSGKWQATLGKKAVGIKVVGKDGERINFVTATLRYIGKIVSGAIMFIGYLMAAFTEKKQALHDLIASTYVVKSS